MKIEHTVEKPVGQPAKQLFSVGQSAEHKEILSEDDFEDIIYQLWELPKWKQQVASVNQLVDSLPSHLLQPLLENVSRKMDSIESDRKDKFYYLISLLLDRIDVDSSNLELLLSYAGHSLISYYWRILIKKIDTTNKDIQNFLVGYIAYCPPFLLYIFDGVQLDKDRVLRILKKDNLGYTNRGYLCRKIRLANE